MLVVVVVVERRKNSLSMSEETQLWNRALALAHNQEAQRVERGREYSRSDSCVSPHIEMTVSPYIEMSVSVKACEEPKIRIFGKEI